MEYILISESKLKVICQESDLSAYGICADSLEYGDSDTRKFLEDVLDYAKQSLDFETKQHRILVQLYPSADGGCEIFIHRLGLLETPLQTEESATKKVAKEVPKKKEKIFFFSTLNSMLEVCKRLSIKEFDGKSSAFYLAEKGYFLSLELCCELEEYRIFMLDEYSFIAEYGEPESASVKIPYLKEYAKCICPSHAVETLGKI